ncbi:MAG: hypothetical protein VKI42_06660 [Synechococcaceae cyanobacterium]|nr:hypothetical protein [Synechococcaceae cyanobacterium]
MIVPELQGRLHGDAVREPWLNRDVEAAANGPLQAIFGVETRPLVSVDDVNDSRRASVDGLSTMVVNGTQLKVCAWWGIEWGYSSRLADPLGDVARLDQR